MARFSLDGDEIEGEEDESGSSSPIITRKRRKLTTGTSPEPTPRRRLVLSPARFESDENLAYAFAAGEEEEPDEEGSDEVEEDGGEAEDGEELNLEEVAEAHEEAENLPDEQSKKTANRQAEAGVNEERGRDGPRVFLSDPDVLDCPVCFENLKCPVFQCENGHVACAPCCVRISNKCPTCSLPIGYNRCRAIEKVLEVVMVSCANAKYGCKHMMKYDDKCEHEQSCIYAPCSCPLLACNIVDSTWNLYLHINLKHKRFMRNILFNRHFSVSIERNRRYLIMREKALGIIFVLYHFIQHQLSAVNVVLIAPKSFTGKYRYELAARDGETTLTLQSLVESVPKLIDHHPTEKFLLVPDYFLGTLGQAKLDVCIWRNEE